MKILVSSVEFYPLRGGIATFVRGLMAGFREINEVEVKLLTASHGLSLDKHKDPTIIRRIGLESGSRIGFLKGLVCYLRFLRKEQNLYDYIIAMDWLTILWLGMAVRSRIVDPRKCCVVLCGSEIIAFKNHFLFKLLTQNDWKKIHHIFCISEYTKSVLRANYGNLVANRAFNCGVAVDFPLRDVASLFIETNKTNKFKILQVSRLVERKGHRTIFAALAAIPAEVRSNIQFEIVGEGPILNLLKREVQNAGLRDSVVFRGKLDDDTLLACYDKCDIYAMASEEAQDKVEGFGIVYIEAARRGKASIATTHGAVPEVVHNGVSGILVPPGDSYAIAQAIIEIYNNREYLLNLSKNAHRLSTNCSPYQVAERVIERLKSPV